MRDSMTIEVAKKLQSTDVLVLLGSCLLIIVFIQLALVSGLPLCQNSYSRCGYDATHIGKFSSPPLSGLCKTSQIPHAADTSQLS
jgi:hypothetical protein